MGNWFVKYIVPKVKFLRELQEQLYLIEESTGGTVKYNKKVLYRVSLYREDLGPVSGFAYVLARNAKNARYLASSFSKSYSRRIYNRYNRVGKVVTICGKRAQRRIRVIKHNKGVTSLYDLFNDATGPRGVIAYSCCRTCLNMNAAFELNIPSPWNL